MLICSYICSSWFKLNFTLKSFHYFMHILFHTASSKWSWIFICIISIFVHVLKFKSLINFLQRLKDFFTTTKNSHPQFSCQLFIIFMKNLVLVENPWLNLVFSDKVLNYFDSVLEIWIDFFLCESDIVRSQRVSVHILLVWFWIKISQFVYIVINKRIIKILAVILAVNQRSHQQSHYFVESLYRFIDFL